MKSIWSIFEKYWKALIYMPFLVVKWCNLILLNQKRSGNYSMYTKYFYYLKWKCQLCVIHSFQLCVFHWLEISVQNRVDRNARWTGMPFNREKIPIFAQLCLLHIGFHLKKKIKSIPRQSMDLSILIRRHSLRIYSKFCPCPALLPCSLHFR